MKMIYSTPWQLFPSDDQYQECHSFLDENGFEWKIARIQNGFEWKIARIQNGFFVGYFGDDYFKDKYFDISLSGRDTVILNTGCFFIQDDSFETYYHFREILKTGYTTYSVPSDPSIPEL